MKVPDFDSIASVPHHLGEEVSLDLLRTLIDEAWSRSGCSNKNYSPQNHACFYADPVWLLNGLFVE